MEKSDIGKHGMQPTSEDVERKLSVSQVCLHCDYHFSTVNGRAHFMTGQTDGAFPRCRRGNEGVRTAIQYCNTYMLIPLSFADMNGVDLEIDSATNKRLLRKIDLNLLPIMCIVYGLNYLDKTTISYASIMGFKTDTKLHGNDYSWVSSMFYFGYIAFEYPTNRLLQLLPIGKFSAAAIVAWGTTLCCMAAVNSYGSALAVRFILGVCESAVTPGFALITYVLLSFHSCDVSCTDISSSSQWYTKSEQGTRVGIWFSFNGFAQILGGLIAYAIARGVDKHGSSIEGWKINFLWTGLLTIVVGIIFFFVVPDNQLNARFLSKEDQILAIERIRKNQQGGMFPFCAFYFSRVRWADLFPVGNKHFKMYQLKEVCLRFSLLQDSSELTYIQGPPRPSLLDVHVLRPRCGLSNSPMHCHTVYNI